MSLEKLKHRTSKPRAKTKRTPTQRQTGKGGWPDYDERENIFFTPTQTTYSDVLTIRNPSDARDSVNWMKEEYRRASGKVKSVKKDGKTVKVEPSDKWVNHIHKAMDNTAKRAEMSKKRKSIAATKGKSGGEYAEMDKVAKIYRKALASSDFGNYYSARRMGAKMAPRGLAGGSVPSRGSVGDNSMKFRLVTQTSKGNRVMTWKPFKKVYQTGTKSKAKAKAKEMKSAGYAVRVVKAGQTRYVYVQTTETLKAIQAVARARSEKVSKRRYERERKDKYRADKKEKAEAKAKAKSEKKAAQKAKRDAKKKADKKAKGKGKK